MVYVLLAVLILAVLAVVMPKRAVWVLLALAVVIGALAAIATWLDNTEQQKMEQVTVSLSYDVDTCPAETPLAYTLKNIGSETVYRTRGRYTVYREGYSTPLSKSYTNEFQVDRILEPQASTSGCIEIPTLSRAEVPPAELRFKLESQRLWFEEPHY